MAVVTQRSASRTRRQQAIRASIVGLCAGLLVVLMLPRYHPTATARNPVPEQHVGEPDANHAAAGDAPPPDDDPASHAGATGDALDLAVQRDAKARLRGTSEDDCDTTTEIIVDLHDIGRAHFSSVGGDYQQCMPLLPPLRKYLPLRLNAPHPRCTSAVLPQDSKTRITGGWKSLDDHMRWINWDEVNEWKLAAPFLIDRCRPPKAINHVYIDVNPLERATGGNSLEWFLRNYPQASQFRVHVTSPDVPGSPAAAMLAKLGAAGISSTAGEDNPGVPAVLPPKSFRYHWGLPWAERGYLSMRMLKAATLPPSTQPPAVLGGHLGDAMDLNALADQVRAQQTTSASPGSTKTAKPVATNAPDTMVDVLNDRLLPTVFHEVESAADRAKLAALAKAMRDKLAVKYPKETVTVPALSLAALILEVASEEDFTVMRLNAIGREKEILREVLQTGAMRFVDELFLVCRCREKDFAWNSPATPTDCHELINTLRNLGVYTHEWFAW